MKLSKKLLPLAVSASIAAPLMMGATVAQADVSATVSVSNFYLWRGQSISNPGAQIAGSIDYSNSGFYAGAWTSSEGAFDASSETDLYLGYGGSVGDFGYDISYWKYLYPQSTAFNANGKLFDNDLSDVVLGLSYGPVSFTGYFGVESGTNKERYYTLSGDIDKFTLTVGLYKGNNASDGADYKSYQVAYHFNDDLTFTLSKISDDGYGAFNGASAWGYDTDPTLNVSYSKTFDLK